MSEETNRDKVIVKTPHGHTVEVKSYLTRAEMRAIFIKVDKEESQMKGKDGKTLGQRAEDAYIEAAVVSIDGKTDGILEKFLNLPNADYEKAYGKIEEALGVKKEQISPEQKQTT